MTLRCTALPTRSNLLALLLVAGALGACSPPVPPADAGDGGSTGDARDGTTPDASDAGPTDDVPPTDMGLPQRNPADCDPLDETECAFPWPSNLYLRPDTTRTTGYTLTFGPTTLPQNMSGVFVDPSSFRRMDGYGVGTPIMVHFASLDASMLADEYSIERSMAADAPVLLFRVQGTMLTRVPYFAELDSIETDPARKTLIVRPAVILEENTRYVVAFRNLRNTMGAAIAPSPAFARLRDGMAMGDPALAPRVPRFTEVFTLLEAAGIQRTSLTLAWDFTTASSNALHGRMLRMRDDGLAAVGAQGPALTITEVTEYQRTGDGGLVNADIALQIRGTYEAPHYMRPRNRGVRGWEFNLDAMGNVARNGTRTVNFLVRVPWSALDGTPHGLLEYGHGLLGSMDEARGGYLGRIANTHRLIIFAQDWTGFAAEDIAAVANSLRDFSNFVWVADRLHQGILEYLVLARAMRERFDSLPMVMSRNIRVNRDELYYYGNSQGGIFGGTVMALSTDTTRGMLGVPGSNYSLLLQRSVDFDRYFESIRAAYSGAATYLILISAIEQIWEGTDPVSYYRHITAQPFPGTPVHHVLLAPAKGDHQVSVMSNEIAARTNIGIPIMANYDAMRMPYGLTPQAYSTMAAPYRGSGIVLWDFGNPWPPAGNRTPPDPMPDPHGRPRQQAENIEQMIRFFRTGEIIDTCGGDGCRPN